MSNWITVELHNPSADSENYDVLVNVDALEAVTKTEDGCSLCIGGFWHSSPMGYSKFLRILNES